MAEGIAIRIYFNSLKLISLHESKTTVNPQIYYHHGGEYQKLYPPNIPFLKKCSTFDMYFTIFTNWTFVDRPYFDLLNYREPTKYTTHNGMLYSLPLMVDPLGTSVADGLLNTIHFKHFLIQYF